MPCPPAWDHCWGAAVWPLCPPGAPPQSGGGFARLPGGRRGTGRVSDRPLVGSTKVELVRAHLGTVSLTGIGGTPVKMGLRRAVLHPQYNPGTLDFDVAVLELARPLGFNTFIQPVCLPLAIQKFPVGRKCMISGWGSTREGNGELPAGVSGPLLQGPQAPAHGRSAAAFSTFLGPQPCPFVESRSPGAFLLREHVLRGSSQRNFGDTCGVPFRAPQSSC